MALNDHYKVTFKMNVVRQPVSFTVNYRETSTGHEPRNDTLALADALDTMAENLHVLLPEDATYEGFRVDKYDGTRVAPAFRQFDGKVGFREGSSIPTTKALIIQLIQIEAPAKHNGRIFWPGPSENDCSGNYVVQQALLDLIDTQFQSIQRINHLYNGDEYNWQMCVIDQAASSPAFVESKLVEFVRATPLLRNQRSRQTRELGTSGAAF